MAKNFVGSLVSYSSCITHDDDHLTKRKLTKKQKRDDALGRKRRNNNWGKLTSHSSSYFFPSHHDTDDVCLCLSLSCTHDQGKKKTCNDDVGKHNNLQLLQPFHDSILCLHLSLASPSCCDQIAKKQKLRVQETNTKAKKQKVRVQETNTKAKKQKLGDQENKIKNTSYNSVDDQQWEIKKVLRKSDVCTNARRLLLNKDLSEKFVIPVVLGGADAEAALQGVQVKVWDIDTNSDHSLVFKIWNSAKCHVFIETWIEKFVQRRNLKKGDQIGLRWNKVNNHFDFSVIQQPI